MRAARRVVAALSPVLLTACVGGSLPRPDPPAPAALRRVEAAISAADRERAAALVGEALHALARSRAALGSGTIDTGLAQLSTALERVRAAQELLPPPVLLVPLPGGESRALLAARPPLELELSDALASTLRELRPRVEGERLRVDLDELERRLRRALAGPPAAALAEVYLAASTLELASESATETREASGGALPSGG